MKESYSYKGVRYWREMPEEKITVSMAMPEKSPLVLRQYLGETLRERRTEAGLRLRDVPGVSLGYVSEVEHGKKEVSSEVLETICKSLGTTVSSILRETADRIDAAEASRKELVNA